MLKPVLILLGALLIFGGSAYVSTQIGFRTEGSFELTVETSAPPRYAAVGQNLCARDGSKVLLNGITRGFDGEKHQIHATVYGTHRYALALFPTRWEHTFSMDRPSVERVVKEASGIVPGTSSEPAGRQWHLIP